jgi:RhtB (resistance to homoserine/threonine) family protein
MYWTEFLAIALAHLLAVASPGPDFAIVVRQSVASGTRIGIWTSAGVGCGILVHVAYCILGVAILLKQSDSLFLVMKYLAAAYLAYLGVQSLRAKPHSETELRLEDAPMLTPRQAFLRGFLTNGLNPKATLFFLALFTVIISSNTPTFIQVLYGGYLALATFAWFAMLSSILGRVEVRRFMLKSGVWFERCMGVLLLLLAVQITLSNQ